MTHQNAQKKKNNYVHLENFVISVKSASEQAMCWLHVQLWLLDNREDQIIAGNSKKYLLYSQHLVSCWDCNTKKNVGKNNRSVWYSQTSFSVYW